MSRYGVSRRHQGGGDPDWGEGITKLMEGCLAIVLLIVVVAFLFSMYKAF